MEVKDFGTPMRVRDIMEKKVIAVRPETTYEEAGRLMVEHNVSGLPVTDAGESLVGLISEKDLFKALYPGEAEFAIAMDESFRDQEAQESGVNDMRQHPVSRFMTKRVLTLTPDTPVLKAGGIMLAHHVHRMPVVENGKLVGIVSREDIYGAILREHFA
jgi:CBS domain-containing protein